MSQEEKTIQPVRNEDKKKRVPHRIAAHKTVNQTYEQQAKASAQDMSIDRGESVTDSISRMPSKDHQHAFNGGNDASAHDDRKSLEHANCDLRFITKITQILSLNKMSGCQIAPGLLE